jgi:hypothetical protein
MSIADFDFHDHGSLVMVHCTNANALAHLQENTDGQWMGDALAVEPRYAPDLSATLCRDGFSVELPNGRIVTADDLAEA